MTIGICVTVDCKSTTKEPLEVRFLPHPPIINASWANLHVFMGNNNATFTVDTKDKVLTYLWDGSIEVSAAREESHNFQKHIKGDICRVFVHSLGHIEKAENRLKKDGWIFMGASRLGVSEKFELIFKKGNTHGK